MTERREPPIVELIAFVREQLTVSAGCQRTSQNDVDGAIYARRVRMFAALLACLERAKSQEEAREQLLSNLGPLGPLAPVAEELLQRMAVNVARATEPENCTACGIEPCAYHALQGWYRSDSASSLARLERAEVSETAGTRTEPSGPEGLCTACSTEPCAAHAPDDELFETGRYGVGQKLLRQLAQTIGARDLFWSEPDDGGWTQAFTAGERKRIAHTLNDLARQEAVPPVAIAPRVTSTATMDRATGEQAPFRPSAPVPPVASTLDTHHWLDALGGKWCAQCGCLWPNVQPCQKQPWPRSMADGAGPSDAPSPLHAETREDETTGAALIAAERQRQMSAEDWTPFHDDSHESAELVSAAICYAEAGSGFDLEISPRYGDQPTLWPFEPSWWKPSDDLIRNLVKAGALIAAEIDRQLRATSPAPPASTTSKE